MNPNDKNYVCTGCNTAADYIPEIHRHACANPDCTEPNVVPFRDAPKGEYRFDGGASVPVASTPAKRDRVQLSYASERTGDRTDIAGTVETAAGGRLVVATDGPRAYAVDRRGKVYALPDPSRPLHVGRLLGVEVR